MYQNKNHVMLYNINVINSLSESVMVTTAVDTSKATMGLKFTKFTVNVSSGSTIPFWKIVILTHCLVMVSENGRDIVRSS